MRSTLPDRWRKSSRSQSGDCVEVCEDGDLHRVRDSKDPNGPVLTFGREAWSALIDDLKAGKLAD